MDASVASPVHTTKGCALQKVQIKEGPCLNNGRCSHGCAKMTFNGMTILVVAGGYNGGHLDSVEILDPFFETLIKK